jgi:hypothetical protein
MTTITNNYAEQKQTSLKLKGRPKQLSGSLPQAFAHPEETGDGTREY